MRRRAASSASSRKPKRGSVCSLGSRVISRIAALHVGAVVAQAARAELDAVHHHVVVGAAHARGVCLEQRRGPPRAARRRAGARASAGPRLARARRAGSRSRTEDVPGRPCARGRGGPRSCAGARGSRSRAPASSAWKKSRLPGARAGRACRSPRAPRRRGTSRSATASRRRRSTRIPGEPLPAELLLDEAPRAGRSRRARALRGVVDRQALHDPAGVDALAEGAKAAGRGRRRSGPTISSRTRVSGRSLP